MAYDFRLTDYKQSIKVVNPNPRYGVRDYPGLAPVLLKMNQTFRVLTQSGYAIGWGVKVKEQSPLFDTHLEAPSIEVEQLDEIQWKTSWSYTMAIADDADIDYETWQATPTAIEVYA